MKFMPYLLIILGLLSVFFGVRMLLAKKPNAEPEIHNTIAASDTVKPKSAKTIDNIQYSENKKKGDDFEAFVVGNFNKEYFTLNEWRSDKYVNGTYAVSNHFPDLEIEFNFKSKKIRDVFAIECKYRSSFYKDSINWAEEYQFKNYQDYALKLKIPVFVIIGVGGVPSKPYEIFIVPLSNIYSASISKSELDKYKRDRSKTNFYWKWEEKILE